MHRGHLVDKFVADMLIGLYQKLHVQSISADTLARNVAEA